VDTCARYLNAQRPLLTDVEFAVTSDTVSKFRKGELCILKNYFDRAYYYIRFYTYSICFYSNLVLVGFLDYCHFTLPRYW